MGFSRENDQPGQPDSEDAFARGASDGARTEESGVESGVALEAALLESKDRYLRLAAEYDNYRKRVSRERQEERGRAQADLVKMLVDGLDDLARVAHVDPRTIDATAAVHGADIAERKLLKALQGAGLEIVTPTDQVFDPALHEAVGTEAALSPEDDHVIARVYQPGYVFNGQLIRPARVVVKQWNG